MTYLCMLVASGLVGQAYGVCEDHCSQCEADRCIACRYGYWGHRCAKDCINCWYGGCKKKSGRCFQCKPGYFGVRCDKHCPENCWSSIYKDRADCSRHTGGCLDDCNVGWWGDQCKKSCGAGCQGACYQKDGACVFDCKKGLFGRFCNKTCSRGCAQGSCDWFTGNCHGGCKCGYTGDKCEDTCSRQCNTPCRFDDKRQCLTCVNICEGHCRAGTCYQNGSCDDGCQAGFYGEQCRRSCPSDCSECEKEPGCSSCFDDMKRNSCNHFSSEVIEGVQKEDEITKASLNVETQLSGDVLVTRPSIVLLISCLILANRSKHQIGTVGLYIGADLEFNRS